MDELRLNLETAFLKNIIAKIIAKAIRKRLGCDINVLINSINVKVENGMVKIHADIDAETKVDNLVKITKKWEES